MSDLRIGKSRYYAHFKLLTDADYIRVEQIKNNNQEYGQNTYMLVERPVGLQNKWGAEDTRADKLRLRGIRAGGYGIIPKACMMDQRLSIQSKGMFAYFCSITGGGDIEFPSVAKLRYFLQISDKSYAKYMKELVDCAYISIRQRWDGKFGTNEYFVNNGLPAEGPDDDTEKIRKNRDTASSESGNEKTRKNEDTRNRDTEKNIDKSTCSERAQNSDDVDNLNSIDENEKTRKNEDRRNQDRRNEDRRNRDINITNYNKTNYNKTNVISQSVNDGPTDGAEIISLPVPKREEAMKRHYALEEELAQKTAMTTMEVHREMELVMGVPFSYRDQPDHMRQCIHYLFAWDVYQPIEGINSEEERLMMLRRNFENILFEMTTARKSFSVSGAILEYSHVIRRINELIWKKQAAAGALADIGEVCVNKMIEAACKNKISNIKSYMKTVLWDTMLSEDLADRAMFAYQYGH